VDQFFQYCFRTSPEGNRRPFTSTNQVICRGAETMKSSDLIDAPSLIKLRLASSTAT